MGTSNKDADGVGAFAAIDATKPHRFARDRTAAATDGTGTMGVKPEAERKAEFFAAMRRCVEVGLLLPKADSLDPADPATIAEAEIILAEMQKAKAELYGMMERERRLRDLQNWNSHLPAMVANDRAGRAGFAPIINPRVSRMEKPNHWR
jgi:hypothetical protein